MNMATQVINPETSTALVHIESMTPAELFKPGAIDPLLERIKKEVRSVPTDISTETGRKAVASLAFKVAKSKTFIDEQRIKLVKGEKERLKAIDQEGGRIWDELEALQKEVRKPLTDWENAEKERVAAHELSVAEIEGAGSYTLQNWQTLGLEAMQDRLHEIQNDSRDWQEFGQRAQFAKGEAVKGITAAIEKRKTYDAEQAELVRLRKESAEREQKEREEQIAKAAAEKSRLEAEAKAKAEQERIEREGREREEKAIRAQKDAEALAAKAEADRLAAIAKAESDRVAAEKRAKEEQEAAILRERERVEREKQEAAAAEAKREANKKHVAKINKEAVAAFVKIGFDEEGSKAIVALIAKGEVPHVAISY
jgi:colicin import membrane protein